MKLILAIVRAEDASEVTAALNEAGLRVTRIATQGAWLRKENSTLLMGVDDKQVNIAINILKRKGGKRIEQVLFAGSPESGVPPISTDQEVGGATIFVLDVVQNERL